MSNIKINHAHIKEIGFKFFRLWTRYYLCAGFVENQGKSFIKCFQCDSNGNVLSFQEIGMNWPLRVWEPDVNFEKIQ